MSDKPMTKAELRKNFLHALDEAVASSTAVRAVITMIALAMIEQKGWPGPVDFGELLDKLHDRLDGEMGAACMWGGSGSGSSILVYPASRETVLEMARGHSGGRQTH